MVRTKHEWADLKRRYPIVFRRCMGISFGLIFLCAILLPSLDSGPAVAKTPDVPLVAEPIIETHQHKRPPAPPRPAVPIETEDLDVPDDVTIAETDLGFDAPMIDTIPVPVDSLKGDEEEEILEFWVVEEKPTVSHRVNPVYPEMARRAGLEGRVTLSFTVSVDGRATDVVVLRGAEIFRAAALEAVAQFRFRPAKQNDRSVPVRMTIPMNFRLR